MQLRELNLSNSILNSELRELEAMSPKWARLHYRMLQLYSSNNTLSGRMVQHENMECTCKSAISRYGIIPPCGLHRWKRMNLLSPSGREVLRKALVEGECEFWDCLCPGFAPNPFLFLGSFGIYSGLVLVGSSSSMEALAFAELLCSTYNACIIRDGGGGQDSHPPI